MLEIYPGTGITPLDLVAALVAIAAGALVQGAAGFGFALVAGPILILIEPSLIPVPFTITALLFSALLWRRNLAHTDWRGLGWIYLGNLPGYLLGALALLLLPIRGMALLFGVLTLVMVLLSLSHLHLSPSRKWLIPMGAASSFMGTTMAMNGPPIALVYQHARGATIRASLASYFFTSNLVLIALYGFLGKLDQASLVSGLLLLPGVVLGMVLAGPLSRWVDAGRVRQSVLWISALSAVAVLVKYL
jgi:uncharacterized membrane protein YfcA